MTIAAKKGNGETRKIEGVIWRKSCAGTMRIVLAAFVVIVSMQAGRASADSTIQNLSKATMSVDEHVLMAGEVLTIAISTGGTATLDLSYTKNITGLKIQDAKEYFVVQNQAGATATLAGQTVAALDLVEAKILESAF